MAASSPGISDTSLKITNPTWLWVGRITWGILFLFSIYTLIAVSSVIWEQTGNAAPEVASSLTQIGLPANAFAIYAVSLQILITLVCFVVGSFIFWRRSDEQMGLLTAVLLVTFGACLPMSF